ncbi:MAG: hypothetical protein ACLUGJ_16075 [Blautia wexlerae]
MLLKHKQFGGTGDCCKSKLYLESRNLLIVHIYGSYAASNEPEITKPQNRILKLVAKYGREL